MLAPCACPMCLPGHINGAIDASCICRASNTGYHSSTATSTARRLGGWPAVLDYTRLTASLGVYTITFHNIRGRPRKNPPPERDLLVMYSIMSSGSSSGPTTFGLQPDSGGCGCNLEVQCQDSFSASHSPYMAKIQPQSSNVDLDDLASSDGDGLSSIDTDVLKELEGGFPEGCLVDPERLLQGVRGLADGGLPYVQDEPELCQKNASGLGTDSSMADTRRITCSLSPASAFVQGTYSSEAFRVKSQFPSEDSGRRCCAGVVPEKAVPSIREESILPRFKGCWRVSEASGISDSNVVRNVERLDNDRMAPTLPSDSPGKGAESVTTQADGSPYNEPRALGVIRLRDQNGPFTHFNNTAASAPPDMPILPLTYHEDRRSSRGTKSRCSRGQPSGPLPMTVHNRTSDGSRMLPRNSLEASPLYRSQICTSEGQWQAYQNDASIRAVDSGAADMARPSAARGSQSQTTSPKAALPTMLEPAWAAVPPSSPRMHASTSSAEAPFHSSLHHSFHSSSHYPLPFHYPRLFRLRPHHFFSV